MWPSLQEPVDLVIFAEDILNGKLYFLWSVLIRKGFLSFKLFTAARKKRDAYLTYSQYST